MRVSSAVPGAGKGRRPTPRVRSLRFDLPAAATPLPGKSGAHDRSGLRTRTKAAPGRDELVAHPCIEHGTDRLRDGQPCHRRQRALLAADPGMEPWVANFLRIQTEARDRFCLHSACEVRLN